MSKKGRPHNYDRIKRDIEKSRQTTALPKKHWQWGGDTPVPTFRAGMMEDAARLKAAMGNKDYHINVRTDEDSKHDSDKTSWEKQTVDWTHGPKPTVIQNAAPDARQVAVQFYLATLGACVSGGILFHAVSNNPQLPFPENAEPRSIISEAVRQSAAIWERDQGKTYSEKERGQVREILAQYMVSLFFSKLKDARIFQFKNYDFEKLYHLADVSTVTAAGYTWQPTGHPLKNKDEADHVTTQTIKDGAAMPFPEKLPFTNCYLAWGTGAQVPLAVRFMYDIDPDISAVAMGTLLSDDGWAYTIVLKGNKDSVTFAVDTRTGLMQGVRPMVILERIGYTPDQIPEKSDHKQLLNPGWCLPFALTPWIVAYAIEAIERNSDSLTVMAHTLKERLAVKGLSKRTNQKFLPAPYYVVTIQPTTYTEIEQRVVSKPKEWSHQWDVSGHWAHRIYTGTLPIDPKLLAKLQKRGYEIIHALHGPSADAVAFLDRRRIPRPRGNQWLAYLKFRRNAYTKGPKDKPYIPSVRRLKGGLPEF